MPQLSRIGLTTLTFVVLCLGHAASTQADTIAFTGSRTTVNNPPPSLNDARCGSVPNLLVTPNTGTGTSNLGAFTTQERFCVNPLTMMVSSGDFRFDFANGSTLLGTIGGSVQPTVNGIQPVSFIFNVTGGSGLFAGATGSLMANGQVMFLPGGLSNSTVNFTGTITTVPEPTTMLLLATGLAGVATKVRKRRKADKSEEV